MVVEDSQEWVEWVAVDSQVIENSAISFWILLELLFSIGMGGFPGFGGAPGGGFPGAGDAPKPDAKPKSQDFDDGLD